MQKTDSHSSSLDAKSESFADFIRSESDAIVDEFAEFARTHLESARRLNAEQLRDTAASLLAEIADDMELAQTEEVRSEKSRGEAPLNSPALTEDAKAHAKDRLTSSFSLMEMVAEYRALRAAVIRRWRRVEFNDPIAAVDAIVRFNEAIDQALLESIAWYTIRTDRARELIAGMIAHDLRNPLGAISMLSQYLVRSEALPGAELKAASRIGASAEVMSKMVDELLDFAQVRLGGVFPSSAKTCPFVPSAPRQSPNCAPTIPTE